MAINNSQNALPAPEMLAMMTGSAVTIGTLTQNPAIIIFDNLSTVAVTISINGVSWKTFAAGSALILDLRAAHANAPNFTFQLGTTFTGVGASGQFSISYVYAKNT